MMIMRIAPRMMIMRTALRMMIMRTAPTMMILRGDLRSGASLNDGHENCPEDDHVEMRQFS